MTSRINPIAPRLWWDVLSASELERIHEATLEVLETVGVRFPSERALDVLEKGGCEVDRATQVAKLPRAVVMEAVSQVPDSYVLAGRDPDCDLLVDGKHCYLSNDGSGVFVWDHHTGEKRPSTKQDAATSARFRGPSGWRRTFQAKTRIRKLVQNGTTTPSSRARRRRGRARAMQ